MIHFGVKLKDNIAQHLTIDNYIKQDHVPSIPSYCEYSFLWYDKMPKQQMYDYYKNVLQYYETIGVKNLKPQQISNKQTIKEILKKLKKAKDDDYIKQLKSYYNKDSNLPFEQYAQNFLQEKETLKSFYDFTKSPDGNFYSDKYITYQTERAIKNFNLNMKYFNSLDKQFFNTAINEFIKNNPNFKQVFDLKDYVNKPGYYVMVLDNYCSLYIGTTDNISGRIRAHWSKKKQFDRLIYPAYAVDSSTLSIDSFKALDTTRIFAYITKTTYSMEQKFIEQIPSKYLLNRIGGGKDLLLASLNRPNKNLTK